jgi:hypothetical protein
MTNTINLKELGLTSLSGLRAKCPKCKRIQVYVTTDKFDPYVNANGSMLRLRNKLHRGGLTYGTIRGNSASTPHALMECTDCGGMLAPTGKLTVLGPAANIIKFPKKAERVEEKKEYDEFCEGIDREGEKDTTEIDVKGAAIVNEKTKEVEVLPFVCQKCGKPCKSLAGLKAHEKHCKG